jgi:hypothetical protein
MRNQQTVLHGTPQLNHQRILSLKLGKAQRTKLVPNLFIIVFFEHCLDVPSFTPRFGRQSRAFAVACTTNRLAPLSVLQAPTQSQWWREVVSR